jgi:hypothetical protein
MKMQVLYFGNTAWSFSAWRPDNEHMTTHTPPPFQIPQSLLTELTKLGPLLDAANQAHGLGVEIFTNNIYQKPLERISR